MEIYKMKCWILRAFLTEGELLAQSRRMGPSQPFFSQWLNQTLLLGFILILQGCKIITQLAETARTHHGLRIVRAQ